MIEYRSLRVALLGAGSVGAQVARLLLDHGDDEVVCGGEVDVEGKYVAPTILRGVTSSSAIMGEEIFGPVLPVLTYRDLGEVTAAIRAGDAVMVKGSKGSRMKPIVSALQKRFPGNAALDDAAV